MADELFTQNDPVAAGTAPAGEPDLNTDAQAPLPNFLSREVPEPELSAEPAVAVDETPAESASAEDMTGPQTTEVNILTETETDLPSASVAEVTDETDPSAEIDASAGPDTPADIISPSVDSTPSEEAIIPDDSEDPTPSEAAEMKPIAGSEPVDNSEPVNGSEPVEAAAKSNEKPSADSENTGEMLPYPDDPEGRYNRKRAKHRLRKQRMFSRLWVICFMLIVFAGIGWYMLQNYIANPLGYFTTTKELDYYYGDDYARAIKADYILKHKDEIEAVVLGGSKSGVLEPELLKKYTGLNYYNMYFNQGNFSDYLAYTQFLISATDIKEITLHLSSYETYYYDAAFRGNAYKLPAAVKGNAWDRFTEFLSFLMTDYETLKDTKENRNTQSIDDADKLADGMRNRWPQTREFYENPDAYVAKYVLTDTFDVKIKTMFGGSVTSKEQEIRDKNIAALREIKQLCDENEVTLKVIIGAGFLGERFYYECNEYYEYLSSIVNIVGEVWDFSQFNAYNLNPYNFINYNHYSLAMGEKMINTVYGGENKTDFGQRLTRYNIHDYLQTRNTAYETLRKEYRETGTIQLGTMDDDSWIVWPTSPAETAAQTLEIEPITEAKAE